MLLNLLSFWMTDSILNNHLREPSRACSYFLKKYAKKQHVTHRAPNRCRIMSPPHCMCGGLSFGWDPGRADSPASRPYRSNSAYGGRLFFLVAEPHWPTTTCRGSACLDVSISGEVSSWSIGYTFGCFHENSDNTEGIAHGVWLTTKGWLWLLYKDPVLKQRKGEAAVSEVNG